MEPQRCRHLTGEPGSRARGAILLDPIPQRKRSPADGRDRFAYGWPAVEPTLLVSWYVDPTVWARERRAVLGNEWLFAGHAHTLREPGDYLAVDIAGWSLMVVVDEHGELRAHHNVCRHRTGPLVDAGRGRVPSLACRYHGWAYGLDGSLRSAQAGVAAFQRWVREAVDQISSAARR